MEIPIKASYTLKDYEQLPERAPDLVIEVLSPSSAYYNLRKKKRIYEQHGVREYWIVDPEDQSVEVFTLQDNRFHQMMDNPKDGVVTSLVIDEVALQVKDIFKT